jgi:hypothetical protein
LRADEILARNADDPAEAGGLRDDLIERVHGFRPANLRDRLHVVAVFEELHAKRDRPQLQQALQVCAELCPVRRHAASLRVSVSASAILYFR